MKIVIYESGKQAELVVCRTRSAILLSLQHSLVPHKVKTKAATISKTHLWLHQMFMSASFNANPKTAVSTRGYVLEGQQVITDK